MQQHGSVYWKCGAKEILASLQPSQSMCDQLKVPYFYTSKSISINLELVTSQLSYIIAEKSIFGMKILYPKTCVPSWFLQEVFSVPNSPIWMDSSTTKQCRNLETKLGGPQVKLNAATRLIIAYWSFGSVVKQKYTGLSLVVLFFQIKRGSSN